MTDSMLSGTVCRVAVIGAGAAGLCAAHHLSAEQDAFHFVVYEQQDNVGGTWRYTDKVGKDQFGLPVHSSMYKCLRTNLPKEAMAFPGFQFENCEGRSFIHHTEVLKYLQDYAKNYNLYKYIKFRTVVEEVCPEKINEHKIEWLVKVRDIVTDKSDSYKFDAVMVCNGHYSVPYIPNLVGLNSYKGVLLHSHEYRNNSSFKNMKVVVLGAGASGIDIAIEVSSVAKEVVLSHNLPQRTCPLPDNLIQETGIDSFGETYVIFLNNRHYECDAVILCTGYLYQYPFLHKDCNMKIKDQRVMPLYKHLFHIEFPTLAIWAIPKNILPFPIYDQQVIVFLRFLKGEISLPSKREMEADAETDFQQRLKRGMKPRHAHAMSGTLQWEYDDQLAELGKIPPISEAVRNLFKHVHKIRKEDVLNYKKHNFKITDDKSFVELI